LIPADAEPARRPAVMGVLNVTPDSFSDGGQHFSLAAAQLRVAEMVDEGATWIDVGGESTRPGAEPVAPSEEQRRVLPVIEAVAEFCATAGVGISIDTRSAETARLAVAAGATLINDVTASLWPVAADLGVAWVAMHMAGTPQNMQKNPTYSNVVDEVRAFLGERARVALASGVPMVWVDPGIGFGKTTQHNLELLSGIGELVADGAPVAIGTSRKRFIGELLAQSDSGVFRSSGSRGAMIGPEPSDPVPSNDRLVGSLATATWAIIHGARMVRVHDVRATVRAAKSALDGPAAPRRKRDGEG